MWKKSVCTKGGTKHLSNIYINTGKPAVLWKNKTETDMLNFLSMLSIAQVGN